MTRQEAQIKQAVILAGGRGTRLKPITDSIPKPMIAFHGRPFLEYLVEMLREAGIQEILLLLGYLPETIVDHFGDGARHGIRIRYSITPVEDETGPRLRAVREQMDPTFLLMYCDNYWPIRLEAMIGQFRSLAPLAQITAYSNRDHYTRDNVRVSSEGRVERYDKTRTAPGLEGVDIGFVILEREAMDLLPAGNVNFEASVYPRLVEKGRMAAYLTDHRYYSVGSHERLPLTEKFLKREPAILLDRDGVLNEKAPKAEYVRTWAEFRWRPGAQHALRLLKAAGYRTIVITNQAGIARGAMTAGDLAAIHDRMRSEAAEAGGSIDAIYHCPHGWDEGCPCRKPRPGMLFMAQRDHCLDLSRVCYVGDDERDAEAADRAGCRYLSVGGSVGLLEVIEKELGKC